MGSKLDHFRDSYLPSLDSQLCSLVLTIKYPLIQRKATTFAKCAPDEYVSVKKVLKNRPNLTLDEIINKFGIVRIEDPEIA